MSEHKTARDTGRHPDLAKNGKRTSFQFGGKGREDEFEVEGKEETRTSSEQGAQQNEDELTDGGPTERGQGSEWARE